MRSGSPSLAPPCCSFFDVGCVFPCFSVGGSDTFPPDATGEGVAAFACDGFAAIATSASFGKTMPAMETAGAPSCTRLLGFFKSLKYSCVSGHFFVESSVKSILPPAVFFLSGCSQDVGTTTHGHMNGGFIGDVFGKRGHTTPGTVETSFAAVVKSALPSPLLFARTACARNRKLAGHVYVAPSVTYFIRNPFNRARCGQVRSSSSSDARARLRPSQSDTRSCAGRRLESR